MCALGATESQRSTCCCCHGLPSGRTAGALADPHPVVVILVGTIGLEMAVCPPTHLGLLIPWVFKTFFTPNSFQDIQLSQTSLTILTGDLRLRNLVSRFLEPKTNDKGLSCKNLALVRAHEGTTISFSRSTKIVAMLNIKSQDHSAQDSLRQRQQ